MRTELTTPIIADLLGYKGDNRVRNARNWLEARGIAMQYVKGGPVFTTDEHLREAAPHIWQRWQALQDDIQRQVPDRVVLEEFTRSDPRFGESE